MIDLIWLTYWFHFDYIFFKEEGKYFQEMIDLLRRMVEGRTHLLGSPFTSFQKKNKYSVFLCCWAEDTLFPQVCSSKFVFSALIYFIHPRSHQYVLSSAWFPCSPRQQPDQFIHTMVLIANVSLILIYPEISEFQALGLRIKPKWWLSVEG